MAMDARAAGVTPTLTAPRAVPALRVEGLSVDYDTGTALENVSALIPSGVMAAIVGPNGAGKSTLIKATLGLVAHKAGSAAFFGEPFAAMRERVAYVPQRSSVDWDFPATALDVALMGLYREIGWLRLTTKHHRDKALAALERVGMADFAKRQIGRLSGGQRQRVFLARALAQNADLLVLDEPFAGVDAATERAIVDVLRDIKRGGGTVICVHHDLSTVADYFDHLILLNRRLVAAGPLAEALTPEHLQAAYGGRLAASQLAAALDDGTR